MAQPGGHDVERDLSDHQPVPSRTVPQAMGTSTTLTQSRAIPHQGLAQLDAVDRCAATLSSWTDATTLSPRRPVRRPVGEQLHQVPMQPHRPEPYELFDFRTSNVAGSLRIVEVSPFQLQDLGDPQSRCAT